MLNISLFFIIFTYIFEVKKNQFLFFCFLFFFFLFFLVYLFYILSYIFCHTYFVIHILSYIFLSYIFCHIYFCHIYFVIYILSYIFFHKLFPIRIGVRIAKGVAAAIGSARAFTVIIVLTHFAVTRWIFFFLTLFFFTLFLLKTAAFDNRFFD